MKENRRMKHERLLSEELFVYADQFKTAALWDKMGELQLFAVQNGDETLYCRVQGKNGLAVYPGQNGLLSYMKALHLRQEDECPDWKLYESAFIEDCVKCTFEDRKTLDDWDYRCIIGLGRSYRGKQAWPMFRRHRPLRYPWYVDACDEKRLVEALKAAIYLSEVLERETYWKLISSLTGQALDPIACLTGNVLPLGHVPMLLESSEGGTQPYQIAIKALPNIDEHFTSPVLTNEMDAARLRRARKADEILQCAITCLPMSIGDEAGGAPHIPLVFVMVAVRDTSTERIARIAAIDMALEYESGVGDWMSKFCGFVAERGKPREVIANEYRADHLLRRLCRQLSIKYTYKEGSLLELDDAIEGLSNRMAKKDQGE